VSTKIDAGDEISGGGHAIGYVVVALDVFAETVDEAHRSLGRAVVGE
jgi:hypothetical protein